MEAIDPLKCMWYNVMYLGAHQGVSAWHGRYILIVNIYVHPQVYDGPSSTRQDSRPRRYATGYPEPKTRTGDDAIGKLI